MRSQRCQRRAAVCGLRSSSLLRPVHLTFSCDLPRPQIGKLGLTHFRARVQAPRAIGRCADVQPRMEVPPAYN
jgi:hypothetical protein